MRVNPFVTRLSKEEFVLADGDYPTSPHEAWDWEVSEDDISDVGELWLFRCEHGTWLLQGVCIVKYDDDAYDPAQPVFFWRFRYPRTKKGWLDDEINHAHCQHATVWDQRFWYLDLGPLDDYLREGRLTVYKDETNGGVQEILWETEWYGMRLAVVVQTDGYAYADLVYEGTPGPVSIFVPLRYKEVAPKIQELVDRTRLRERTPGVAVAWVKEVKEAKVE